MTGKEYVLTQMTLIKYSQKISELDFEGFLKCIENAETMAVKLDPKFLAQAKANLEAVKELAKKFQEVKEQFLKVQQAIVSTSVAYMVKDPQVDATALPVEPHSKLIFQESAEALEKEFKDFPYGEGNKSE